MDIAKEIKEDQVGVVTVTLSPEDYKEDFTAQIKKYRNKVQLPGFRPGTVPMGLVRKRFGAGILFDKLSKDAMNELMKYVQEENLKVLGRPYLMRSNLDEQVEDLENTEYFFEFQMGIQPEVELNIDKLPELVKYTVKVSKEDVADYIKDLKYKSGTVQTAEKVADTKNKHYILQCMLEEQGEKEDPLTTKLYIHTRFQPKLIKRIDGKTAGDTLEVKLEDLFDSERAAMQVLEVSHEYYHELEHSSFKITIEKVEEQVPAEENVEWYNKMLGVKEGEEQVVKDEAEFKTKVEEYLQQEYDTYAGRQWEADFIRALLNAHPFPLPVTFIRQFLLDEAKDDKERENINENLSNYLVEFRLRFIYDALMEQNAELKVSDEQVKEAIKEKFKAYMQPVEGAETKPEEQDARLDELVNSFANSPEMMEREARSAQDVHIREWLLENKFKQSAKTLSAKEFDKATAEPDHHH